MKERRKRAAGAGIGERGRRRENKSKWVRGKECKDGDFGKRRRRTDTDDEGVR